MNSTVIRINDHLITINYSTPTPHPYILDKCEVLFDFGLTDANKLYQHLEHIIQGCDNSTAQEIHIDNVVRRLLADYFGGDYTYCLMV